MSRALITATCVLKFAFQMLNHIRDGLSELLESIHFERYDHIAIESHDHRIVFVQDVHRIFLRDDH